MLQRDTQKLGGFLLGGECRLLLPYFLNGFVELLPEGSDRLGLMPRPFTDLDAKLFLLRSSELVDFLDKVDGLFHPFGLEGLGSIFRLLSFCVEGDHCSYFGGERPLGICQFEHSFFQLSLRLLLGVFHHVVEELGPLV